MKIVPACLLVVSFVGVGCGAPVKNTPIDDIPKLTSLDDVMDNQATVADPQMKKASESSYTDADWEAFNVLSQRIGATSKKIKDFTKGPEFDAFADKLGASAKALGEAASAKDAAKAGAALKDMKANCKGCHSKFR